MIPKVINQMWLDGLELDNKTPPSEYDKNGFYKILQKHNQDFEYRFWNRKQVLELLESPDLQRYKPFWNQIRHHIEKCDFARYMVMYEYGGFYLDLDFISQHSLNPLVDEYPELALVWEPVENSQPGDPVPRRLFNGFLGSVPKHPFWLDWMDWIVSNYRIHQSVNITYSNTGPLGFGMFMHQSKYLLQKQWYVETKRILPFKWTPQLPPILSADYTWQDVKRALVYTVWQVDSSGWQVNKYLTTKRGRDLSDGTNINKYLCSSWTTLYGVVA